MIVIKLKGGLGNQMFQYALGKSLSSLHNVPVFFDTGNYDFNKDKRTMELGKFNIDPLHVYSTGRPLNPLLSKYLSIVRMGPAVYIERKIAPFDHRILQKRRGIFDGYWQSELYFSNIREVLLKQFVPKNLSPFSTMMIERMKSDNYVSLHVRRTDYNDAKNVRIYSTCDIDYYTKAISTLKGTGTKLKVIVFSDDYQWVRSKLDLGIEFETSEEGNHPAEDIFLMSRCSHNIIANSTFSWWGAWLNRRQDRTVIAPRSIFRNEKKFRNDLVPASWLRIGNDD